TRYHALRIIRVSSAVIDSGHDLPGETSQRSTASRTIKPAGCKEGDSVSSRLLDYRSAPFELDTHEPEEVLNDIIDLNGFPS
ncbi:MAG: hypothetical protein ACLPX7_15895, partial [Xanthobacteraceae bacterium]